MTLFIKKFGGTSVGSLERIQAVADQLAESYNAEQKCVVVVSAMSGETDRLLNLAQAINPKAPSREIAALVTTGEQVSMTLLAMALCARGIKAKSYNGSQLAITTDNAFTKARILNIDTHKIQQDLAQNNMVVVAGFQGITQEGDVTALGRGGSDTSAVALAAALNADECQIYTDVDGVYSADPRLVPKAYRQEQIDFRTMLECANLGAKVLQLRSVELAGKYQVPLRILSSFKPGSGTLIHYIDEGSLEAPRLTAISHQLQLNRISVVCNNWKGHELSFIISMLAKANINIDHVSQHINPESLHLKFIFNREELEAAEALLTSLCAENAWLLEKQAGIARLALVGLGLHSYPWISAKFFEVLHHQQIHPLEVIHSELALTIIIPESDAMTAAQALHHAFFEH